MAGGRRPPPPRGERIGRQLPGPRLLALARAAIALASWAVWATSDIREAGPSCGGRLRVIATVQDPLAVRAILAHLARRLSPAPPRPALPAPTTAQ